MHKTIIRPLKISDASISYIWRNDAEIWKYTGNKPNVVVTEELERIWITKKLLEKNSNRFSLEVDDEYIGNIQLTNITDHNAEFHIFIGNKDYWGKGIAYIGILQLLRYAKNKLPIKKIYLNVNPENKSAINLYKKVGFKIIDDMVNMEFQLENEVLPTVSVFCMVYNHEKYLRQCLDGFLMQKCNFDFDIVVGEDCSTDKSREILLDYANRYPGKFKLILHDKNVGAMENQRIIFENCAGKYIGMCEGDDYWIDSYKLQKQVDFLEANLEYSMVGHYTEVFESVSGEIKYVYTPKSNYLTLKEGIFGPPVHTSSLLFRNNNSKKIKFPKVPSGDEAIQLHCLKMGNGFCFPEIMSRYRLSESGSWSNLSTINKNTLHLKIYIWIFLNSGGLYFLEQLVRVSNMKKNMVKVENLSQKEYLIWSISKTIIRAYKKINNGEDLFK